MQQIDGPFRPRASRMQFRPEPPPAPPPIQRNTMWQLKNQRPTPPGNRFTRFLKTRRRLLIGVLVGALAIGGALWWVALRPLRAVYADATVLQQKLAEFQATATQLEIDQARLHLGEANQLALELETNLNRVGWMHFVPVASGNLTAVEEIVSATKGLITASDRLITAFVPLIDQATGVVVDGEGEGGSGGGIGGAEFGSLLLSGLRDGQLAVDNIRGELVMAELKLERLNKTVLIPPLRQAVNEMETKIGGLHDAFDAFDDVVTVVPSMLGETAPRTYLIVIQNNTELRPAGGFWGNYGLLTVEGGKIGELEIDDIYNIDNDPLAARYDYDIPYPLGIYLDQRDLHLRDSAWWPDIPTSSRVVLDFFEHNTGQRLEDIIYIDPIVIEDILRALGPIEVPEYNKTVNADNVTYEIQYQVHRNITSMATRKDFVGVLGQKIMTRVLGGSSEEVKAILKSVTRNLAEKHIQLYATTPALQEFYCRQQWCGAVAENAEDYLMVVEANLGINKVNFFVERDIAYRVREENGRLIGQVTIEFDNPSNWGWPGGAYVAYTRVFVPHGSELIAHKGYHVAPQTGEDFVDSGKRKTVFGGVIRTDVKSRQTATLTYRLPESVSLGDDRYELIVQKQAGTPTIPGRADLRGVDYRITVDGAHDWTPASPHAWTFGDNGATLEHNLVTDQTFELTNP